MNDVLDQDIGFIIQMFSICRLFGFLTLTFIVQHQNLSGGKIYDVRDMLTLDW